MFTTLSRKLSYIKNGLSYLNHFQNGLYDRMLGHHKIIGYDSQNLPVYSMIFPSHLGTQYRASMEELVMGLMRNVRPPQSFNIAVTDMCDCDCVSCYFKPNKTKRQVLNTEELKAAFQSCQNIGATIIVLVGGEPLLRKDLIEVLSGFDTSRTNLVSFTNGTRLAEKAQDLKKAGLERILVSLDYPDAKRQEELTHHKGLFDKITRGLVASKKAGILTGLSVTIHDDTTIDDLRGLIDIAKEYQLNEIYLSHEVNAAYPGKIFNPNTDKFFPEVKRINADKKVPFAIFYYSYVMSRYAFGGCSAGVNRGYISPYGDVTPCDVMTTSFGNVRDESLHDIWFRMSRHKDLDHVYGQCRRCLEINL